MKYLIANWKMNLNLADITNWLTVFKKALVQIPHDKTVIIAPSAFYLGMLAESFPNLAAQDVSSLGKGAHTGSLGVFQAKDFCKYAIIGHSELGEPQEVSITKRDLCLDAKITPILCFANPADAKKLYKPGTIMALEDPANISVGGVNRDKPSEEIAKSIAAVRAQLPKEAVLIYGGSINQQNVGGLSKIEGLDGGLVGNASCDPIHFAKLVVEF